MQCTTRIHKGVHFKWRATDCQKRSMEYACLHQPGTVIVFFLNIKDLYYVFGKTLMFWEDRFQWVVPSPPHSLTPMLGAVFRCTTSKPQQSVMLDTRVWHGRDPPALWCTGCMPDSFVASLYIMSVSRFAWGLWIYSPKCTFPPWNLLKSLIYHWLPYTFTLWPFLISKPCLKIPQSLCPGHKPSKSNEPH